MAFNLRAGETLEQLCRDDNLVEHRRLPAVVEDPLERDHRVAGPERERPGHFGGGLAATHVHQATGRIFVAAVVAPDAEKPEHRGLFLGVRGHEGALALPADDQIVGREGVDGLAHGSLRDPEPRRQLDFAGNRFGGAPLTRLETLDQQTFDLQIERPERGRRVLCRRCHDGFLANRAAPAAR